MLHRDAMLAGMRTISILVHDMTITRPKATVLEVQQVIDEQIAMHEGRGTEPSKALQIAHQPQKKEEQTFEAVEWKEAAGKMYMDEGKKPSEIAKILGVSWKKVANHVYTKFGGVKQGRRSKNPRRTTGEVRTLAQAMLNLEHAGKTRAEIAKMYKLNGQQMGNLFARARKLKLKPEDLNKSMLSQIAEGANTQ